MFIIKFFQFIKGYVILKLSGYNKEVTLEKIRKMGVVPWDISYHNDEIFLCISEMDFSIIKAEMNEESFTLIKEAGGIFFLKKIRKHCVLAIGLVLIFLSLLVGSKFIWTVEYDGVSEEKLAEVENAAIAAGIKVGALKSGLLSPLELKNTILAKTHDISWCWVYIKGTRAVIEVRENLIPPQIFDPNLPCDIVAAKDAVIKKVIAKRGTCVVKDNTTVSCGDVLISGRVDFGEDEGYFVHASGDIEAETYYEKEGIYKLYRNYKTYTGRKRNFLTLKLFSWEIPLYFNGDIAFKYWDKEEKMYEISLGRENYLGIGLEKVSYIEYNIEKEPISPEVCAEFAKLELEEEIAKELMAGSVLISSDVSVNKIDEETISVKLMMNFTEKIAAEKIIEEVTIIEPKTD